MLSADSRLAAFKSAIADRYLIDAELGHGGMAVVYLARDVRLGRPVAVKVLAPDAASPDAVKAFHRESAHMLGLEHPHILPLFDVGEAHELPFYVARYIKGGSLRRRLNFAHRLSLADATGVVRQTAAALAFAHGHRILHCDVKPENILIDGDHVYLADFGISRVVRHDALQWRASSAESSGGTPTYVSPEQAFGEPDLDGRSDLFSLACIAWEMLAGQPPFIGSSDRDIVARRFAGPADAARAFPRSVPASVRSEIGRALSLEPERRQPSVSNFAEALDALADEAGHRRGGWRAGRAWGHGVRVMLAILAAIRA
jgi:eukaryotic-like serine/threonine-protein kinase